MRAHSYCGERGERGLACAEGNLELVRTLMDYADSSSRNRQLVYRCGVCGGLYKYVHSAHYETRNFDCEEGWNELLDRYFKVGEVWVGGSPFPVLEARSYGYEGEDATP